MNDRFKQIGTLLSAVIFSVFTRTGLGIWLFLSDPLSLTFRYLIVIIFCLPVIHYLVYTTLGERLKVAGDEHGSLSKCSSGGIFISALLTILYAMVLSQVFSMYERSYGMYLLLVALPVLGWSLLTSDAIKKNRIPQTNKDALLNTLLFYIIPFLAAANYAFDFSTPTREKYFIVETQSTVSYDSEMTYASDDFSLLPADSVLAIPNWQEVSYHEYHTFGPIYGSRYAISDSGRLLVLKRKKEGAGYYLLVVRTNASPRWKSIDCKGIDRFQQFGYITILRHRGLLGIEWYSYR